MFKVKVLPYYQKDETIVILPCVDQKLPIDSYFPMDCLLLL